jgi:hypothetical protein
MREMRNKQARTSVHCRLVNMKIELGITIIEK